MTTSSHRSYPIVQKGGWHRDTQRKTPFFFQKWLASAPWWWHNRKNPSVPTNQSMYATATDVVCNSPGPFCVIVKLHSNWQRKLWKKSENLWQKNRKSSIVAGAYRSCTTHAIVRVYSWCGVSFYVVHRTSLYHNENGKRIDNNVRQTTRRVDSANKRIILSGTNNTRAQEQNKNKKL